eukprot:1477009-Prorocentrum_lima.AAC.1
MPGTEEALQNDELPVQELTYVGLPNDFVGARSAASNFSRNNLVDEFIPPKCDQCGREQRGK